ncbi:MAG: hypothetical protein QOG46_1709 [Pseudonocardiales bacterium]|jgi:hypothetical protein|nr:hypothetical protein [Pseudonocardiales bacterium]
MRAPVPPRTCGTEPSDGAEPLVAGAPAGDGGRTPDGALGIQRVAVYD